MGRLKGRVLFYCHALYTIRVASHSIYPTVLYWRLINTAHLGKYGILGKNKLTVSMNLQPHMRCSAVAIVTIALVLLTTAITARHQLLSLVYQLLLQLRKQHCVPFSFITTKWLQEILPSNKAASKTNQSKHCYKIKWNIEKFHSCLLLHRILPAFYISLTTTASSIWKTAQGLSGMHSNKIFRKHKRWQ